MPDIFARIGLALASIGLTYYIHGRGVTADGVRLCKKPRPSPFHLRWLIPAICRNKVRAWVVVSWFGLVVSTVLFPGDLWAAALWVCMPWFRTMVQAPVLVDAPAFACSLAASQAPVHFALPLAAIGGAISERVPVWIGLYSLRWELVFVGMTAVLIAWKWIQGTPREGDNGPFKVGRLRGERWTSLAMMVLPWGAGIASLFGPWNLQEAAVVVVAYGQLLAAFDTSRLYMWAAPVVLPKAMAVLPLPWRIPAIVISWFNPWAVPKRRGEVVC